MIEVLPETKVLGRLSSVEIYEYFDGPKLFVAQNDGGQLFLAIWVGEDAESETYWLVAISRARYVAVRSGGISIASPFEAPELGYIFSYQVIYRDSSATIQPLLPEQLDGSLLPNEVQRLSLATDTLPIRFADLDLRERASANRREVLGVHLNFEGMTREEAPTGGLGRILVGIQDTLDALGQQVEGKASLRGSIQPEILAATQTQVVQAGGGSFALELDAAKPVNLFNESLVTDVIRKFIALIEAGSDVDTLRSLLIDAQPRAAAKYKKFLNALIVSESSVGLSWVSPEATRNAEVSLTLNQAADALRTAEQVTREVGETREFLGYFDGVEIPRRTFLAVSMADEAEFRGRILNSALSAAEHITIKQIYRIKIRETIETSLTGEEKPRYELEEIVDEP